MNNMKLEDYQKIINDSLWEYIPKCNFGEGVVHDAMKYSLTIGGKRIRPVIVLEACRICGGDITKAIPFAVAVEMIHTYSLIHDDLPCMDNDDIRRGKPSCHKAFGEAFALLSGDGLLTMAFNVVASSEIASERPNIAVKAIKMLSEFSGVNGMIGGQVLDLKNENIIISAKDLDLCNDLKTGALIRCSAYLGALCADADKERIEALDNYAINIGRAFQIIDDILNVVGDEIILGKPIGTDMKYGKSTYVSVLGLEDAERLAEQLTEKAVDSLECFGNEADCFKEIAYRLVKRNN